MANDVDFLLEANKCVLKSCKIEAVGVINGMEAFETVTVDEQGFDLVILDLNLALMDGFAVATKLSSRLKK